MNRSSCRKPQGSGDTSEIVKSKSNQRRPKKRHVYQLRRKQTTSTKLLKDFFSHFLLVLTLSLDQLVHSRPCFFLSLTFFSKRALACHIVLLVTYQALSSTFASCLFRLFARHKHSGASFPARQIVYSLSAALSSQPSQALQQPFAALAAHHKTKRLPILAREIGQHPFAARASHIKT